VGLIRTKSKINFISTIRYNFKILQSEIDGHF
jgi:hypothetical protein